MTETSDLVKRLRDETSRLDQRAFNDRCGSPDCALASILADEAADAIERLGPREFREAWKDMVAGRPVIPPDVWEQMVERLGDVINHNAIGQGAFIEDGVLSSALRAALSLPETETRET